MNPRAVVAGGAGFIGHHFVNLLKSEGYDIVIVDNLATGTRRNVSDLVVLDHCEFVHADVSHGIEIAGPVDYVVNLACPASPVDFERIPIEIMNVCSQGSQALLELALHKGARYV
ncbi:MAG TPA: NAD-dependent epimerase/dehydratase family protein [Armatimonadota bacterium]|nr:NAD-dependent epimerase/dehydratase family protein [Armatimonadota bacterium]